MNSTWKMVLPIVVTTLVIGGGTYWYVNSKATTNKAALQSNIDSLQANVNALNKKVANMTPTSTTKLSTETSDWKTYTNSAYKISFKYPASFTPKDSARSFDDSKGTSCQVVTLDSKTSFYACDAVANLTTYGLREPDGMDPQSTSDLMIGGRSAKKYVSDGLTSYVVLSPSNNRVEFDSTVSNTTVLEQLLSSLTFN